MLAPEPTISLKGVATYIRWIALLAAAFSLAWNAPIPFPLIAVLSGAALWYSIIAFFSAHLEIRSRFHALFIMIDWLIAILLFTISGGAAGVLAWIGILPVMTTALFLAWKGALAAAFLAFLLQAGTGWLMGDGQSALLLSSAMLVLYILTGLVFAWLGSRMNQQILRYQKRSAAIRQDTVRTEAERRKALFRLLSALSASLNYQRVLDTALDLSTQALSSREGVVSAVFMFSSENGKPSDLHVASSRRFTPADQRILLPAKEGVLQRTIERGITSLSRDLENDPELSRIVALRSCHSAYCLPLKMGGMDICGVMLFAHQDREFFNSERREVLDLVGSQITVTLENARLYQELEQEKERMMEIQEEARKKMARDLHDGPTQSVAAIAMRVNFARRLMERDLQSAADELYKIEDMARQATREIRHMLFTLRPLVLESQGLIATLDSMAQKMEETYNQKVIIEADPDLISHLEIGKQGVIFYIIEEAVTNARKHAEAVNIWVRLRPLEEDLALVEIEDNGVGFELDTVEASYQSRNSLGMMNMRERADLINGLLNIKTAPGKGSMIQLVVPLTEEASDRIRRRMGA